MNTWSFGHEVLECGVFTVDHRKTQGHKPWKYLVKGFFLLFLCAI